MKAYLTKLNPGKAVLGSCFQRDFIMTGEARQRGSVLDGRNTWFAHIAVDQVLASRYVPPRDLATADITSC